MAKYNVELADIEQSEFSENIVLAGYEIVEDIRYASNWKYLLAEIISRFFCCKTCSNQQNSVFFYGFENDAKAAREIFKYLYKNGSRLAEQYCWEHQVNKDKESAMYAFLWGFCEALENDFSKHSTSLMLVIPRQVEETFEEYSKNFEHVTNVWMADDEDAYQSGKKKGKSTLYARFIESQVS